MSSCHSGARVPKYSKQTRPGGNVRAYVRINGKRIYLGRYGSRESRQKYADLIAGSSTTDHGVGHCRAPTTNPTVNELLVAFLRHAQTYYRKPGGELATEYHNIVAICKILRRVCGTSAASEFGPNKLREVRQSMIEKGWSRRSINKQINRVRHVFKWSSGQELLPVFIPQSLQMVAGLRQGRCEARETAPVRPVADEVIEATLVHLPDVVADMVRVQRLTGMRPGELVAMRPGDIDRRGAVWLYRPADHKTAHLDHARTIAIGPKAQDILLRYLARGDEMFCFRPRVGLTQPP